MSGSTSSYRLILSALREHAGRALAGSRLPSEHDLARRYAVSRGTARRALDELVHEGRAVRVQGKGSFVAAGGAPGLALPGGRRTVALVVGDVRRTEPRLLHAVEAACETAGYRLLLASSRGDADREIEVLRQLRADGCAGFLIRSYQHERRRQGLDDLLAAGVPRGPELGRRLRELRDRVLDGDVPPGRESELAAALALD